MSEPSRFLGSGGLKAKLLASAKEDRPPTGSRRRAILAAAAAAAASTQATSATATLSATTLGRWVLWKWIAVGALGAGTVVAAKAVVLPSQAETASTAPLLAPVAVRSDPRERKGPIVSPPMLRPADPEPIAKTDEPSGAVSPPPVSPVPHAAVERDAPKRVPRAVPSREISIGTPANAGSVSAPNAASVASGSTLSEEIAAIDRAKQALARGDAADALRQVQAYGAAFPGGVLTAEAAAVQVEALARTGHLDEARAALARLRVSHPDSPLLENLAAVVGE